MTPPARPVIAGTVSSAAGPVALARVAVELAPGPMPDLAALSDARGRFTVATVGPGTYRLAAFAEGFDPGRVQVEVMDADVRTEIVVLPTD